VTDSILVVDDDRELRAHLNAVLSERGYRVLEAASAAEAEELGREEPALILLDLGLPDRDGMDLLARFRTQSQRPIIVLSARDGDEDKVIALDTGADDYLTKPFSASELLARIRVALRHARDRAVPDEPILEVGPIRIDHERHEVTLEGQPVKLTPIEFKLLVQLARRAGKVMTHRQLLEGVWGAGKTSETHYLRVHVQALRRKIERDPSRPRWLVTETGIGYRLRDE
jgi:two-component system, OmpR family, KDP operon response regulator KdpE